MITVTCQTERCDNNGIAIEIPDTDGDIVCGACGTTLRDPKIVGPTWDDIRHRRDYLLSASDWTQVGDAPVDSTAWAAYRQALRDVPQDFDAPDEVVWPTPPS